MVSYRPSPAAQKEGPDNSFELDTCHSQERMSRKQTSKEKKKAAMHLLGRLRWKTFRDNDKGWGIQGRIWMMSGIRIGRLFFCQSAHSVS